MSWFQPSGHAPGACVFPGSVKQLRLARVSDITEIPEAVSGVISTSISPANPDIWKTYTFQRNTVIWEESPAVSPSGLSYSQQINGFGPGMAASQRAEITGLPGGFYIIEVTLFSGKVLLLGTIEAPMQFQPSSTSGRRRTDKPGSNWEFYGVSLDPAPLYEPASPCESVSAADFAPTPWLLGTNNELIGIFLELNISGSITSIDGYPQAILKDPLGNVSNFLNWNNSQGYYEPVSAPFFLTPGTWSVEISNIPITVAGVSCSATFSQMESVYGALAAQGFTPSHNSSNNTINYEASIFFNQGGFGLDSGTAELYQAVSGGPDILIKSWDASGTDTTIMGTSLHFNNIPSPTKGETYYMVIPSGFVIDDAGSPWAGIVAGAWVWTLYDEYTFTLIPADEATNVGLGTVLRMFTQTGSANYNPSGSPMAYLKEQGGPVVKSWVCTQANPEFNIVGTGVGQEVQFLGATLDTSTTYELTFDQGIVIDQHGDQVATMAAGGWNFTTANETTAPQLVSTSPADQTTGIDWQQDLLLVATFDEAVVKGNNGLQLVIKHVSDDSAVYAVSVQAPEVEVNYLGVATDVAITIPALSMEDGTDYYIEIADGFVVDLYGNAFGGTTPTDWRISTASPVVSSGGFSSGFSSGFNV